MAAGSRDLSRAQLAIVGVNADSSCTSKFVNLLPCKLPVGSFFAITKHVSRAAPAAKLKADN